MTRTSLIVLALCTAVTQSTYATVMSSTSAPPQSIETPSLQKSDAGVREEPIDVNIAADKLSDALMQWARQTHSTMFWVCDEATARNTYTSAAVSGRLTPSAALEKLLAGSPLTFSKVARDSAGGVISPYFVLKPHKTPSGTAR